MDASKRSAHSNAFMYGFHKNKRIVLFDTLIDQCTEGEIVSILGHELGHWKLKHTPILFVSQMIILLVQLSTYTFIRNSKGLYESFGFRDSTPELIGLILFQFIISPVDVVITFLSNLLSRLFEYQADRFAVGLGYATDLKSGLIKLHKENKSAFNIDRFYSTYHFSHPGLGERLKAIDAQSKKAS